MAKVRHAPDSDELAPTRLSLIERLRDLDDQGSWQEFFDTYWKLIYCAAVKGGLPENEAEDVVQETIIGIARNMENFRYEPEICSFKGWLMHVTRCRISDHLRKIPSAKYSFIPIANETKTGEERPTEPEEPALCSASEREFEDLWDEEWKKNLVEAAMERVKRKISPEHYQIFYLHSIKGMLGRDIAELFGSSLAKVYVIRHRVSRMIKLEVRALERKGLQR